MSFDERTQTMNIGTRDWLEASKNLKIRAYLPPLIPVEPGTESPDRGTQFTATGYEIPVTTKDVFEEALDKVSEPQTPERA